MHSTLTASEADPRDVFMIESLLAGGAKPPAAEPAPGVSPASAPPVNIAPDFSAIPAPTVEATIRAAADDVRIGDIRVDDIKPLDDEPAPKWMKRLVMSVLALCGAVAAAAWQHHGDTAKQMIADLTPSIVSASSELTSAVLGSSPPAQTPDAAGPPASAVQAANADQAATPAPPAQPSQAAAPTPSAPSPESIPSMQSMARDLAAMGQEIEQLKASIEQMKTAQAHQAQMATAKPAVPRTIEAAIAAPAPRAKMPPRVRAAAAPAYRPKPAYSAAYSPPPVAAAPPPAVAPVPPLPERAQATATDGEPVVRPPMPMSRWGD